MGEARGESTEPAELQRARLSSGWISCQDLLQAFSKRSKLTGDGGAFSCFFSTKMDSANSMKWTGLALCLCTLLLCAEPQLVVLFHADLTRTERKRRQMRRFAGHSSALVTLCWHSDAARILIEANARAQCRSFPADGMLHIRLAHDSPGLVFFARRSGLKLARH